MRYSRNDLATCVTRWQTNVSLQGSPVSDQQFAGFARSYTHYSSVVYSVFQMQRRTDLWGPDALEFDPDRWLDARLHKYVSANPFIFLPFNAGPRICLGQQQAYNNVSYMLIRLLQHFDGVELALDAQPPDSLAPSHWEGKPGVQGREKLFAKAHLTTYLHKGLWVRMNPVD